MESSNIYKDIAKRTDGGIYIGVVGPVRSGKSTLIKKFMETMVLPNIEEDFRRERAMDEMPQSAAGRTIMTTEPKFIPEEAVRINIDPTASFDIRMIDCVGYIVPSSLGYIENQMPRMVQTPWFDEAIPFNMAAEIGTQKVINEHSTIGLVVTTDGSISDIPREEYAEAEERVIRELTALNKPFVVLLNCVYPNSPMAQQLRTELEEKYSAPVIAVNCIELSEDDIKDMLKEVLYRFPISSLETKLPAWLCALPNDHWLRCSILDSIRNCVKDITCTGEINGVSSSLSEKPNIRHAELEEISLGDGTGRLNIELDPSLFYKIIEESTGMEIADEGVLMELLINLSESKKEYDKFKGALEEVEATGYGIVLPGIEELSLEEPEIVKQGGKYGVRLKASAPSIHLMKANIDTEIAPIVGSEKQSEDLVKYLLNEFEENPKKIWESNLFGKSLHDLVNEGLHNKLYRMPADARMKMQETIERIINDGCSGLICIIL